GSVLDRARHSESLARELPEVRQHLEVERHRRDGAVGERDAAVAGPRLDAALADAPVARRGIARRAPVTRRGIARARAVAFHEGDQLLRGAFRSADLSDLSADRHANAGGLMLP